MLFIGMYFPEHIEYSILTEVPARESQSAIYVLTYRKVHVCDHSCNLGHHRVPDIGLAG